MSIEKAHNAIQKRFEQLTYNASPEEIETMFPMNDRVSLISGLIGSTRSKADQIITNHDYVPDRWAQRWLEFIMTASTDW